MPVCPECESRHDSKAGVAQHMVMSNDHAAETRDEAWGEIMRNESNQGDGANPPEPERNESNETSGNGGGDSAGENPILDGPDPEPKETNESVCPECGGNNWFDATEWTEYERGCADCSDDSEWVVYDA